jgi:DNA-binding MarR family transcriptional regulator
MDTNSDVFPALEQTIARVTHLIAGLEASAFQQDGFAELSMRQVLYMETIARLERPSFSELALALGVTRPSVTALVGRLMRNGYVQKIQDGEDRRSFHILLTHKGEQFTQMHAQIHRRMVQTLIGRLEAGEVEQLRALLDKALGG